MKDWYKNWCAFKLTVIHNPSEGVFRAVLLAPWETEAQMCKAKYKTLQQAKARCWGMVKGACEVRALKASGMMLAAKDHISTNQENTK